MDKFDSAFEEQDLKQPLSYDIFQEIERMQSEMASKEEIQQLINYTDKINNELENEYNSSVISNHTFNEKENNVNQVKKIISFVYNEYQKQDQLIQTFI